MKHNNYYGNWFTGVHSQNAGDVFKRNANTSAKRRSIEDVAVKRLSEDIVIVILPRNFRSIARNNSREFENEVLNFVKDKLGRNNIVCDQASHPENRLPGQSISLDKEIFLTPAKCKKGMPVWEFLKFYLLLLETRDENIGDAIEEWSGIPRHIMAKAYKRLIEYIRARLQREHEREDTYGSLPQVKVTIHFE